MKHYTSNPNDRAWAHATHEAQEWWKVDHDFDQFGSVRDQIYRETVTGLVEKSLVLYGKLPGMKKHRKRYTSMRCSIIVGCMLLFMGLVTVKAQQPTELTRPPQWLANWLQVAWEQEKIEKKIVTDTIFIHHTAGEPGVTWQGLSDIQKAGKGMYDDRYKSGDPDPLVKGLPPHSGHYRLVNGVMTEVFFAYQWLIRTDGAAERLLEDYEMGWQAGNWRENMRSVAICLDGDFSKTWPSEAALNKTAELIAEYSKKVPLIRLKEHSESATKTICPGPWFSTSRPDSLTGREQLLKRAGVTLAQ